MSNSTRRTWISAGYELGDSVATRLSQAARHYPGLRPQRHHVEQIRDIPYAATGDRSQRLDVYRPTRHPGPWPVVLYIHGGGFRMLSKDTHWAISMGLGYARQGYLVCSMSYRLAPRHPFPSAIADACAALHWIRRNIEAYGGDPQRVAFAGESAGANLAAALAIAACYPRPEPFARVAWEAEIAPRAVIAACGIFQVSDIERFVRGRRVSAFLRGFFVEVGRGYLQGRGDQPAADHDLADPLVVFERGEPPARPLPSFFMPVGTRDPLLADTERLAAALTGLGVINVPAYYPDQPHAFLGIPWRESARRCWADIFAFLDQHVRTAARPGPSVPAAAPRPLRTAG
jgi:acetyl esterase